MNLKNINKFLALIFLFLVFSFNSNKDLSISKIDNIDNQENEDYHHIDLKKYFTLSNRHRDFYDNLDLDIINFEEFVNINNIKINNGNYYEKRPLTKFILDDNFLALSSKGIFNIYNLKNFKIKSSIDLNIHLAGDKSYPTSIARLKNNFFTSFSEGKLISFDLSGKIIWIKDFGESIKTPIKIINDSLLIILGNRIILLDSDNGNILLQNYYENNNYLNANGGDVIELKHLIFFILPNGNLGSFDTLFNEKKDYKILNSNNNNDINNSYDKLSSYKNYISFFDQNKFLTTLDIVKNDYIVKKKEIHDVSSYVYLNNAIITLDNNRYIKLTNILNFKLFWELNLNEYIDINDDIVDVSFTSNFVFLFFKSGLILNIDPTEGSILSSKQLKIKDIVKVDYHKNHLIFENYKGKTSILNK